MSSSWHITYDILVIVSAAEQPARRSLSIQKWKVSDPAILVILLVQHPALRLWELQ